MRIDNDVYTKCHSYIKILKKEKREEKKEKEKKLRWMKTGELT